MSALERGQTFKNGKEAKYAVEDCALSVGKSVKVGPNGGGHKKFICTSETGTCPFFVQLYQLKVDGKATSTWRISSLALEHINCTSVPKMTGRQLRESAVLRNAVSSDSEFFYQT